MKEQNITIRRFLDGHFDFSSGSEYKFEDKEWDESDMESRQGNFTSKEKSKYLKYCWELNVKKIMFDTEKVRSLTCMEKKSSELKYSFSFFSLLQVEDIFFTSFY